MISLLVILAGLYGSWHYMDLESDESLYSLGMPILFGVLLITLLLRFILKFRGIATKRSDSTWWRLYW